MNIKSVPLSVQAGMNVSFSAPEKTREELPPISPELPLSVYTQNFSLERRDSIPFHWHNEFQLVWVHEGRLNYHVNDNVIQLDSNQLLLINRRQLHCVHMLSSIAETVCINFDVGVFHPWVLTHCVTPYLKQWTAAYCLCPMEERLESQIESFSGMNHTELDCMEAINFLNEVWKKIIQDDNAPELKQDFDEVEQIRCMMRIIQEHYMEPMHLQELCRQAAVNRNRCAELFLKYAGCSPMRYLNSYRLCRAKELLLETNRSVTEVCESVGFHQVSNFIAQFRHAYGITPLAYRKQYRICADAESREMESKSITYPDEADSL